MTTLPRPGPLDTQDGAGTELDLLWDQMADVVEATEAVANNAMPNTAAAAGALIAGATAKGTPADADLLGLSDSAAGNVLRGLSWTKLKAALSRAFPNIPFSTLNPGNSWLWKHLATTGTDAGSLWVHVPIGSGYHATFGIGTWGVGACLPFLGRFCLGLIGTFKHHSAGTGVTKTGAWTLSGGDTHPAGSSTQSSTAGDTISLAVTGHTLVLRNYRTTNGGYAVVSIDGSWTAANRLPLLTADDIAAGIGRPGDVGKAWINCYANNVAADFHTVLADGLSDGAHTVIIEATGTKPAAASTARVYVGGIVGCSAADVGQALVTNSRVMATVEKVFDLAHYGSSAFVPVFEIEKSSPGTYEFSAEIHGLETQEALVITVDGVDQSALAAGAYAGGSFVAYDRISTVASSDLPGTPVARRRVRHTFTGYSEVPCTVAWSQAWLVAKRVRSSYWAMLPIGMLNAAGNGMANNGRWDTVTIGDYTSVPTDLTTRNSAQHGNGLSLSASVGISGLTRRAYVAALDGGLGADYFANACPDRNFVQDRTDFLKIYCCRSTQNSSPIAFAVGDVARGVLGFGITP